MKLYVCWGTFKPAPRPGGHPCGNAFHALKDAGYQPEVIKTYGWAVLPAALNSSPGRLEVERLTGNRWVPVLVTDQDDVIQGSDKIMEWARSHPASGASASAAVQ
jgi:hypothetical protein